MAVRKVVRVSPVMTVPEVAKLLKVQDESIRRNIKNGRLRGARVGRQYLISGDSVVEILNRAGITARVEDPE